MGLIWRNLGAAAAVMLAAVPGAAAGPFALSVEDGKQPGPGAPPGGRTADMLHIFDLSRDTVQPLAELRLPTSMIGPPLSVAIAGGFAVVTASQRVDPAKPDALLPDDIVSTIDLRDPRAPRLVAQAHAGSAASGTVVTPSGQVLVANAAADSISAFAMRGGRLTRVGDTPLPAGSRPVSLAVLPGGRQALAVAQNRDRVIRLALAPNAAPRVLGEVPAGLAPYSMAPSRDGRRVFVTNLGRGSTAPDGRRIEGVGMVTMLDARTGALLQSLPVGRTPEHVAPSPDGRLLAVVLINGSNAAPSSPGYRDHGFLKILAIGRDGMLSALAEAATPRWCQGVDWTPDGGRLLLQCAADRTIETYRFDGRVLTHQPAAAIRLESRPGAIAVFAGRR